MSAPHPDDERLSAALDGHDAEALAHADGCAQCAARLAGFQAVAALVGAPVSAPRADDAVAAALGSATVTSLRPGSRRGPFALAAAAMLLVVLAAVSVITGRDDSRTDMAASTDAGSGSVAAGGAAGADLGDQSDPTALADRLRGVVEPPVVAGDAQVATDAPNAATGGATTESAQSLASRRSAAMAPTSGGPCGLTVAQEFSAGLGPLVYTATLRWEGTPAVAVVYRIDGATGSLDHRVLVMATSDCRLLVAQTF